MVIGVGNSDRRQRMFGADTEQQLLLLLDVVLPRCDACGCHADRAGTRRRLDTSTTKLLGDLLGGSGLFCRDRHVLEGTHMPLMPEVSE